MLSLVLAANYHFHVFVCYSLSYTAIDDSKMAHVARGFAGLKELKELK